MSTTDILVIGSGAAGLNFALNAAKKHKVTLVTKKELFNSNTNYAQGGIAAVMSPDDDFSMHMNDTLKTGAGLCDENAVSIMVREAPKHILRLMKLGVPFTKKAGELALSTEAGHSKARIIHAKDTTGKAIEGALVRATREEKNITILENHIAFELIVTLGKCYGADVLDLRKGEVMQVYSKATIVATGGIGQLYAFTTNPNISTGDGIALAYRVGAVLQDLEFVQFHPTMLDVTPNPNFLISETLRGEGAWLVDSEGKRFMKRYHEKAEMAPRDVVARAIMNERRKGKVYVDITHKDADFIRQRFPMIHRRCLKYGIDITKDRIPVISAAHYLCGGIKTDEDGATNIKGLYSFGETACTGVHGANRLASNSLLESVVFSERAYRSTMGYVESAKLERPEIVTKAVCSPYGKMKAAKRLKQKIRILMWEKVGIIRRTEELEQAVEDLKRCEDSAREMWKSCLSRDVIEALNMATVGRLIATSALMRKESRGTHFVEDRPKESKTWQKHILLSIQGVRTK